MGSLCKFFAVFTLVGPSKIGGSKVEDVGKVLEKENKRRVAQEM